MANLWVGTDYYIPSIDSSGDIFTVAVSSTTTSNTYSVSTDKNAPAMNTEAVGATTIVWLKDFGFEKLYVDVILAFIVNMLFPRKDYYPFLGVMSRIHSLTKTASII